MMERYKLHGIETRDYTTLILGASHGSSNINPDILREKYDQGGVFNACLGGEYPIDSYFLLRDAIRNHKLKHVIYELDPAYWRTIPSEAQDYLAFEASMSFSRVKLSYFRQKVLGSDFRTFLFPWYNFRDQFKKITTNVAQKMSSNYKDYGLETFSNSYQELTENGQIRIHGSGSTITNAIFEFKAESLREEPRKYFLSLVQLCRDQGIPLTVITTPVPKQTYDQYESYYKAATDYYTDLCKNLGVTYFDFNAIDMPDLSLDISGFTDNEGHMLEATSDTFTQILAEYLNGTAGQASS